MQNTPDTKFSYKNIIKEIITLEEQVGVGWGGDRLQIRQRQTVVLVSPSVSPSVT